MYRGGDGHDVVELETDCAGRREGSEVITDSIGGADAGRVDGVDVEMLVLVVVSELPDDGGMGPGDAMVLSPAPSATSSRIPDDAAEGAGDMFSVDVVFVRRPVGVVPPLSPRDGSALLEVLTLTPSSPLSPIFSRTPVLHDPPEDDSALPSTSPFRMMPLKERHMFARNAASRV